MVHRNGIFVILGKNRERMKKSFAVEESRCELIFRDLRPCWHLYTPENYTILLQDEADYRVAMTLLALCCLCFPSIRILTFQWMSNHLHIVLSGPPKDISSLFGLLKKYLGQYLKGIGRSNGLGDWEFKLREIEDLRDIRNVIAYTNRNGFIVHLDTTPFSYPWGANRYFFNPEADMRFEGCTGKIRLRTIRQISHTHGLDGFVGKPFMDGIVPPPVFCDIRTAEGLYRNAHHYFWMVSKNVEGMKGVAEQIGESIFYTDEDLFSVVLKTCRERYGIERVSLLPAPAKVEIGRQIHFEYNATAKQVARILKLDPLTVASWWPGAENRD